MITKGIPVEKRIIIVKTYLNGGQSIRAVAKELGIHYITLWRWVEQYRVDGEEGIKRKGYYRRPWNRSSKEIEEKVVFLKENNPSCTVRAAKEILEKDGIKMSIKGIWSIWKRYGLAGFIKEKLSSDDFRKYISIPPETEEGVRRAREFVEKGNLKEASKILNQLSSCCRSDILEKIPNRFLNSKRKFEKLSCLFGKIPYSLYRKKARKLRETFVKKGYLYSAIRTGLSEATALEWLGKPVEQLGLIQELKKSLTVNKRRVNFPFIFTLNILEGIAYAILLEPRKAILSLRKCQRFKRNFYNASVPYDIAVLYSFLGYYREMGDLIEMALPMADVDEKEILMSTLSYVKSNEGDYKSSIRILKNIRSGDDTITLLIKAQCYIGMGRIEQARELAERGLLKARKMGIKDFVSTASLILSEVNSAIREKRKARLLLSRYIDLLKKSNLNRVVVLREVILNRSAIPEGAEKNRTIRLALLLRNAAYSNKISDYRKAYQFANRYNLLGFFHRLVLLIPDPVLMMLEKGKDTGLPRALLNLPVFRKEIPVYSVKFLGHLVVYKNQKYLRDHPVRKKTQAASSNKFSFERSISLASRVRRKSSNGVKLSTKETSFLIYLALSKNKSISLDRIYKNFWHDSKHSSRNLAHLLVRIRKALRLPSHYLYVKENRLFFDCYFTTDYGEYTEHLAQAKALLLAGEWAFARREYFRAFKLFRGKPFRKIYDDWSEDKRLEILFAYETEVLSFAKELRARGRRYEAEKLLKKAKKIIPYLDFRLKTG